MNSAPNGQQMLTESHGAARVRQRAAATIPKIIGLKIGTRDLSRNSLPCEIPT